METALIVTPADYPAAHDVVGERITVLASGEATGGYEIFLQQGAEGSGPPPHSHPWDESFFVVGGEVEFGVGDTVRKLRAGSLVHIPAGSVHWFRFLAGGGEMVSVTSRAGASRMFAEIGREIAPQRPDFARLASIASRHEVTIAA